MPKVTSKSKRGSLTNFPVHPTSSCSPSSIHISSYFSVDVSEELPDISKIPLNFINAYLCRPRLIQEEFSGNPWKLLVATLLLNKTTGKRAIPVFRQLMDIWPTPEEMAEAPFPLLKSLVQDLGFGNSRPKWIIDLSTTYVKSPPSPTVLHRSRAKDFVASDYPPTIISHLPHVGKYALDSYRIFCCGDEWKSVRPRDKELIKYLKWKWAFKHFQEWDPEWGIVGPLPNDRFLDLCAGQW
ncbi:DNA glycosylase [Hysterangium stoloniferum]|nr:DNA glycosylase [Hysterangium stoloniferum]